MKETKRRSKIRNIHELPAGYTFSVAAKRPAILELRFLSIQHPANIEMYSDYGNLFTSASVNAVLINTSGAGKLVSFPSFTKVTKVRKWKFRP